jgi:hypothetical protein
MASTPQSAPDLARLFASRGNVHVQRYLHSQKRDDLEKAISTVRTAIGLAQNDSRPVVGPMLAKFGTLWLMRYECTDRKSDLDEALRYTLWGSG